jgi:hypothetical protein
MAIRGRDLKKLPNYNISVIIWPRVAMFGIKVPNMAAVGMI